MGSCYSGRRHQSHTRVNPIYGGGYYERRRHNYQAHVDSRTTINEKDMAGDSQRKRIAVACGRCRKRKIRCSGDLGDGMCTNCKNSNNESCQFLRVSSTETAMKNDTFNYSINSSRQYQSRGSSVLAPSHAVSSAHFTEGAHTAHNSQALHRHGLGYQYMTGRLPHTAMATSQQLGEWHHGYAENHNLMNHYFPGPYQALQEPAYNMHYRLPAGPSSRSNGALLADTESHYGFSSGPATSGFVHRTTPVTSAGPSTPQDTAFSFQGMATGLAASLNGSERLLPPPVGRPLPSMGYSSVRNGPASPPIYSRPSQSSTSGTSPAVSPFSDAQSSYTHYDSSSMTPYTPAPVTMQIRTGDNYTTSGSAESLFSSANTLRANSVSDMTYRYTDTTAALRDSPSSPPGGVSLSHGTPYISQSSSQSTPYVLSDSIGSSATVAQTDAVLGHFKPERRRS